MRLRVTGRDVLYSAVRVHGRSDGSFWWIVTTDQYESVRLIISPDPAKWVDREKVEFMRYTYPAAAGAGAVMDEAAMDAGEDIEFMHHYSVPGSDWCRNLLYMDFFCLPYIISNQGAVNRYPMRKAWIPMNVASFVGDFALIAPEQIIEEVEAIARYLCRGIKYDLILHGLFEEGWV